MSDFFELDSYTETAENCQMLCRDDNRRKSGN